MRSQLHAGQLRYHDFAPLREAHYLRNQRNFINYNIGKLSNYPLNSPFYMPTRPIFNQVTKLLNDRKLKILEKSANTYPQNLDLQYELLKKLSENYPEAVVQRFETNSNFVVDERCALLYLQCLQRLNQMHTFNLGAFNQRLMQPNGHLMNPVILEELQHIAKDGRKASKSQLASSAMKALFGQTSSAGATAVSGGFLGAVGSKGIAYGADMKHPLHVNYIQQHSFKETLLKAAFYSFAFFIVTSAIGAMLDDVGVARNIGGGGKHIQEAEGSDVRFSDVKGVEEAKVELEEIVMYLRDPSKFTRLGGKLPRGLLLTGPPGTGKTLLAKAIAGEAGVPFFFSSGSQFEEVYVGLGAKRVRELFEAAKKKSPCIIFIDEIDALGGSRRLKDQSSMKQTLNELLVQLDGFDENSGIIVIGATNFAQSLDEALLRPGRFDKHVDVPLPDIGGRKEILELYAKKTKLAPDVSLDVLARGTVGMSGADLYNLINQAAVKASVDGLNHITMHILEYAKDKILMGAERKSAIISAESAKCTAYHEAGHAVVAVFTDGALPIHKATIMPRGQSLGMVSQLPEGDQKSQSYKQMVAHLDICLGGRIAEELIFGAENITTGASSDIQQATNTARSMITQCGFSEKVGFVNQENASASTKNIIDEEIKRLIDDSYVRTKELLIKRSKEHHLLAQTLLQYESLTGDEVRDLLLRGRKPSRPVVNHQGGAIGKQKISLT